MSSSLSSSEISGAGTSAKSMNPAFISEVSALTAVGKALPTAVNAETSDINAGFIDLADVPAPDISEEESEEDTETTSKNTED